MKRNLSIQTLTILMAMMFLISGQISAAPKQAASAAAPKTTGIANMVAVSSEVEGMQGVGPDDSVLVISGKVFMGDTDYYGVSVAPNFDFSKKPGDGTMMINQVMQLKSNAAAGYKTIFTFRDTGKNAKMWKFFQEFTQLTMKDVMINFKRTKDAKWEQWGATTPSLPKTYPVGPVQPK